MHTYLSTVAPDYRDEVLNIPPHTVMEITGKHRQILYTFHGGTHAVLSVTNTSHFDLLLQWEYLTEAQYNTLFDLWNNEDKANFMENTFLWVNPVDDRRYTARFMSEIDCDNHLANIRKMLDVHLRIEGNDPLTMRTSNLKVFRTTDGEIVTVGG